jgi:hypothetical protein
MPPARYILGLDLGQAQDFSALAIVEKTWHQPAPAGRPEGQYAVRHLQRWPLGTSYPQIVADVAALAGRPPLDRPLLALDRTGVGAAVADLFRAARLPARLRPILITAGSSVVEAEDGCAHVPKKELVSTLQVVLQTRRLRIAPLPERELLLQEFQNFRVKITAAANETFEAWRERDHDDLVLAVALACWLGEQLGPVAFEAPSSIPEPPRTSPFFQRFASKPGR